MKNNLNLIITQSPYSTFIDEITNIDCVSGIRLNTIMPIKEGKIKEKLIELNDKITPKTLWIDLKSRQLRITEFANTPYTVVKISHKIKVNTPTIVYFDNGNITGKLVDIDGDSLILEDYVGRMLGPGESVNIIDESLEYLNPEFLTDRDTEYLIICKELGLKYFMLSFVERKEDIEYLRSIYPDCVVCSKIENKKGLSNIEEIAQLSDYVMAARGDLYTEIDYPHNISAVMNDIVNRAGDKAIAASRMLISLLKYQVPSCSDIMDIQFLKQMGYNSYLIGDDICFKKDILKKAINIFKSIYS